MSETKTETPLEHFGAWTRTAEADGIGKGGTVLANDLVDLYEIVGSEYCRAQGFDNLEHDPREESDEDSDEAE